jgi:hypothetical protein
LLAALRFFAGFWMRGNVSPLAVNADYLGDATLLWKFQGSLTDMSANDAPARDDAVQGASLLD